MEVETDFDLSPLENLSIERIGRLIDAILHKIVEDHTHQDETDYQEKVTKIFQNVFKISLKSPNFQQPDLQLKDLENIMQAGIDQFEDLFEKDDHRGEKTNVIRCSLLSIHARFFSLIDRHINNFNTTKFTPFRSNLLTIGQMFAKDAADLELEDKETRLEFAHNYWLQCSCSNHCHTKALFNDALNLHMQFKKKKKNDVFNDLGNVLANARRKLDDDHSQAHRFEYSIGGVKVCKGFFCFVYGVTRTTIETLQLRIREGQSFQVKWKSHNIADTHVMDCLEIFLDYKIEIWAMPNPNTHGADFFLPANFSWKEIYREFVKDYKQAFNCPNDPISWTTYFNYYQENYDTLAKLTLKTDYCNFCCKSKMHLDDLKGVHSLTKTQIESEILRIQESIYAENPPEDAVILTFLNLIIFAHQKLVELQSKILEQEPGDPYDEIYTLIDEATELRIQISDVLKNDLTLKSHELNKHFLLFDRDLTNTELKLHSELAQKARSAYSLHRQITAIEEGKFLISFDYSENILLPHLVNEPSLFYFKTKHRYELFGIMNEGTKKQANYITDELFSIGKGPNAIISQLDHYLLNNVKPGAHLVFYADNAPGQNKNRDLIAYFAYLVKVLKRYASIEIYYMVAGHTKFSPDGNFGNIKSCINKTNCFSILNLVGAEGCVQKAPGKNTEVVYKDPVTKIVNFVRYDWQSFLKSKFKACHGIQKWHIVKVQGDDENIQVADYLGNPFKTYSIMNQTVLEGKPNVINSEATSQKRLEELKFFEGFVLEEHKIMISSPY